jgi:hypothetical protein
MSNTDSSHSQTRSLDETAIRETEPDVNALVPFECDGDNLPPEPFPTAFEVRDAATANWLVRRIVEARAYAAHVETWAGAELRRARTRERSLLDRYGTQLKCWLESELARRSPRRRSVPLPAGTVGLRKLPSKLVVKDQRGLLRWCQLHLPGAIRVVAAAAGHEAADLAAWTRAFAPNASVTERVSVDDMDEYICQTGEIPDGTEILRDEQRLFIK